MRTLIVAIACVFVASQAAATQQLQPRAVPTLESVESFAYQSPSMSERYALNVGIPREFKRGDGKKYPVLIVADGDRAFPKVYLGVRSLSSVIEPIFVISIGTPQEDGSAAYNRRRGYEFSPPDWDRKNPFGEYITKGCNDQHIEAGKCTGGATRFLNAIVSELLPLIAAKYPIDTGQVGLYGASAGGFFAVWTIFQPNSPFKKYLISSPAMERGDVFRDEERYAATHRDLAMSIYLGAGMLEASDEVVEGLARVVSGMTHLTGTLAGRHYPSLKVATEVFPGMGHGDVDGATIARGLRTLYPKP